LSISPAKALITVEDKAKQFLQKEYISLWKSYGVDSLPNKEFLMEIETLPLPSDATLSGERPTLESVRKSLGSGCGCTLCPQRKNLVFGGGNPHARLMFVGEAPGADEDAQGLPFVGRAGQLLGKIIEAMGFKREEVYLANVVKCRPPQNRIPEHDEVASCSPFLQEQIQAIGPRIIVALGTTAACTLLETDLSIAELRGKMQPLAWDGTTTVIPTFHPAYLLRNPEAKKQVWEDMKMVMAFLEANP
jgi:uracil-DNA glycosylase